MQYIGVTIKGTRIHVEDGGYQCNCKKIVMQISTCKEDCLNRKGSPVH